MPNLVIPKDLFSQGPLDQVMPAWDLAAQKLQIHEPFGSLELYGKCIGKSRLVLFCKKIFARHLSDIYSCKGFLHIVLWLEKPL